MRFGIRTLFAIVFVIALLCLAYKPVVRSLTTMSLRRDGWEITNRGENLELYDRNAETLPTSPSPAHFGKIRSVTIVDQQIDQHALDQLRSYEFLKKLRFDHCRINSRDLKALHDLKELQYLEFYASSTMPGNMDSLSGITSLRELTIILTAISTRSVHIDTSSLDLPVMNELTSLTIGGEDESYREQITGVLVIDLLDKVPNLERLILNDTHVGDELVPFLAAMPKLRRVEMQRTRLTRQGFKELRIACPELQLLVDDILRERYHKPQMDPDVELEVFDGLP